MGLSDCCPNDDDDYDDDDDSDDDDDNDDNNDNDDYQASDDDNDNDDDNNDDDKDYDDDGDDGSSHLNRKSKSLHSPGGICSLGSHHPADLLHCTTFSMRTVLPRSLEQMGPLEK